MSVAQQLTDGRIRQKPLSNAERGLGLLWLQRIYQDRLYAVPDQTDSGWADWSVRETVIRLQGELYAEMRGSKD